MRFPRRLIDLVGAFARRRPLSFSAVAREAGHPSSGGDAAGHATMIAHL
jgi:hypothetical protein